MRYMNPSILMHSESPLSYIFNNSENTSKGSINVDGIQILEYNSDGTPKTAYCNSSTGILKPIIGFDVEVLKYQDVESPQPFKVVQTIENLQIGKDIVTIAPYALASLLAPITAVGHSGPIPEGIEVTNSLHSVSFETPSSLQNISAMAFAQSNLTSLELPEGLKTIGYGSFMGNVNLTTISLPDSLEYLEIYAIAITGIEEISIPANIEIQPYAFTSNTNLEKVYFKGLFYGANHSSPSTAIFESCPNLTDIYVPFSEGEVSHAPWGATNATVHYNHTL